MSRMFTLSGSNDSIFKKDAKDIAKTNLFNIKENSNLIWDSFITIIALFIIRSCNLFNFRSIKKMTLIPAFLLNTQLLIAKVFLIYI